MWKEKGFRRMYMLSQWHILEYVSNRGRVNHNELIEYFNLDRREAKVRIERGVNQGWLKKIGRRTNAYELGKRALTFLDDYRIGSFLTDKNPKFPNAGFNRFLAKSKERCVKLKKRWCDVV